MSKFIVFLMMAALPITSLAQDCVGILWPTTINQDLRALLESEPADKLFIVIVSLGFKFTPEVENVKEKVLPLVKEVLENELNSPLMLVKATKANILLIGSVSGVKFIGKYSEVGN